LNVPTSINKILCNICCEPSLTNQKTSNKTCNTEYYYLFSVHLAILTSMIKPTKAKAPKIRNGASSPIPVCGKVGTGVGFFLSGGCVPVGLGVSEGSFVGVGVLIGESVGVGVQVSSGFSVGVGVTSVGVSVGGTGVCVGVSVGGSVVTGGSVGVGVFVGVGVMPAI
jgi:hypothetical protein